MRTSRQAQASRLNGALGGRPRNDYGTEARRRNRELARKLLLDAQIESLRFLIYTRDDPNAPRSDRVRCALELLNRGDFPAKSANFVGVGAIPEDLEVPKMFVLGKFAGPGGNGSSGNGDGNGKKERAKKNGDG